MFGMCLCVYLVRAVPGFLCLPGLCGRATNLPSELCKHSWCMYDRYGMVVQSMVLRTPGAVGA